MKRQFEYINVTKKNMQIHEILQIKDKLQTENVDMRIIKQPQKFHNKSYATSC